MKSRSTDALVASLPFLAAFTSVIAQAPIASQGCFSSSNGMTSIGSYMYQSPGYCQQQCSGQGKAVMATTKGTDCWCGDELPPVNSKTSDSSCNTKCAGYGQDTCGGSSSWSVALTGLNSNPGSVSGSSSNSNSNSNSNSKDNSNSDNTDSSSTSTASSTSSTTKTGPTTTKTPSASVVTHASTIVVTAPGHSQAQTTVITTTESPNSGSGGPNVAGIAAGVVVGVVAVSAIAGGLFFYLRNRKRKALEDEYKQNAASSYNNLKPATSSAGSTSDSRLEPSVMMQRRQSDGSIADNQDYSRRILKVTNPDGS